MISSENEQSPSTFAEYPKKVAFCRNITSSRGYQASCSSSHEVSSFPGQVFSIPLLVVDDACISSKGIMQVKVEEHSNASIFAGDSKEREVFKELGQYCEDYIFSITDLAPDNMVTIEFFLFRVSFKPALLKINLINCPPGYQYVSTKGRCECSEVLISYKVQCIITNYSLDIPPLTWLASIDNGVAVNQHCQFCNNEMGKNIHINESDNLCIEKRTGIYHRYYGYTLWGLHMCTE